MVLKFGGVSRYYTWVFNFKGYNVLTQISGKKSLRVFGGWHHKKLKMVHFWKIEQKIESFPYIG